jgi:hypothetical protein
MDSNSLGSFCQWCRCPIETEALVSDAGAAYFCSYACVEAFENDIDQQEEIQ